MKLKKVEIVVMGDEEYGKHLDKAFEEAKAGKVQPKRIVLKSVRDISSILSPERIKILRAIKEKNPESITQLAGFLGRDRRNVLTDLKYLEGFGLIEIEERKEKRRAKELQVAYSEIMVHIPV